MLQYLKSSQYTYVRFGAIILIAHTVLYSIETSAESLIS